MLGLVLELLRQKQLRTETQGPPNAKPKPELKPLVLRRALAGACCWPWKLLSLVKGLLREEKRVKEKGNRPRPARNRLLFPISFSLSPSLCLSSGRRKPQEGAKEDEARELVVVVAFAVPLLTPPCWFLFPSPVFFHLNLHLLSPQASPVPNPVPAALPAAPAFIGVVMEDVTGLHLDVVVLILTEPYPPLGGWGVGGGQTKDKTKVRERARERISFVFYLA